MSKRKFEIPSAKITHLFKGGIFTLLFSILFDCYISLITMHKCILSHKLLHAFFQLFLCPIYFELSQPFAHVFKHIALHSFLKVFNLMIFIPLLHAESLSTCIAPEICHPLQLFQNDHRFFLLSWFFRLFWLSMARVVSIIVIYFGFLFPMSPLSWLFIVVNEQLPFRIEWFPIKWRFRL